MGIWRTRRGNLKIIGLMVFDAEVMIGKEATGLLT